MCTDSTPLFELCIIKNLLALETEGGRTILDQSNILMIDCHCTLSYQNLLFSAYIFKLYHKDIAPGKIMSFPQIPYVVYKR